MEYESIELNHEVREKVGGTFIELTDGYTHYELKGPAEGELVVLIHGFSIPMFCWDANFEVLVSAGFRVLRYDLYGRGFSSRPDVKYTPELFERQCFELLRKLGLLASEKASRTRVVLVGASMGGLLATIFTERNPKNVKALILFDPAGMKQKVEFKQRLMKIPGLNKRIFAKVGNETLLENFGNNFAQPEKFLHLKASFEDQMQYKDFQAAILSSMNNIPLYDGEEYFERAGQIDIPKLVIWGKDDQVMPFELSEKVLNYLQGAEFLALDNCGHSSNIEQAEAVNARIIEFLRNLR